VRVAEDVVLPADDPALPLVRRAADELGVRAWAVGGYVRDALLGRPHPDLDVVVGDGRGIELAERFASLAGARPPVVFPRFGTAQVTFRGRMVEFVSARRESYDAASRKPERVEPAGVEEDLRRRDFTVNTLLIDMDGRVHDLLGGRADLERGVLRTPDDPVRTFEEDPLRMLRAIRFSAQLGFRLDPALPPVIRRLAHRLRPPVLSAERVTDELRKMLVSPRPRQAMEQMASCGLLEVVLPELAACQGVAQGGWHTHDVFGHSLLTVEYCRPDARLRLAALLHDIGKPPTAGPGGTFHGHDVVGAEIAAGILRRLRVGNALADDVVALVRLHMRPIYYSSTWSDGAVRRLARDAGPLLDPLLELAQADTAASAYPRPEEVDELAARVRSVLTERPTRFRIPVDGDDIMRVRGLTPGPEVGRIKRALEELVLDGTLPPDRETLLAHLRDI
jgi:putative nucleotidyltransferase with HDIG domain